MMHAMLRMMIDDNELKARFERLVTSMGENYTPRDSAYELVRSGDIRNDEADRLAALFDWYPFTVNPTGREYDPMESVFWTPPMVLSWIAYRSIAQEIVPEWRAEAYRWAAIPNFGWDVVGYEPLTLTGFRNDTVLSALVRGESDEGSKLDLAMNEFLRACRREQLAINARDPSTGVRRAPNRIEWQDMNFAVDGKRDVLNSPLGRWTSPTAEAETVMTLWPAEVAAGAAEDESEVLPIIEAWPEAEDKADGSVAQYVEPESVVAHWRMEDAEEPETPNDPPEQPSPQPKASRASRLAAARKWYAERVEQWVDSPRGPKAEDDYKLMKERFQLGRKNARLVRGECAPDEWKQSGSKNLA